MTGKEIIKDLEAALKMFGTYSYYDKGPHEVMDVESIASELRLISAKDAGTIMKEVGAHEHGERLRDELAGHMDDMPERWFTEMLEVSGAEY